MSACGGGGGGQGCPFGVVLALQLVMWLRAALATKSVPIFLNPNGAASAIGDPVF